MYGECFLKILKTALEGEQVNPDFALTDTELREVLRLAEIHKVLPLIFDAAFTAIPQGDRENIRAHVKLLVSRQTLTTERFLASYKALNSQGLYPIVVKGIICRNIYPKPDLRCSSDEDLLIEPSQEKDYISAMDKLGLMPGDKVYANYNDKTLVLFCMGQKPITEGMNLLGAHLDSPRLDLKPNPLYEDTDLAMLKTHYYGGVKKYQWVTLPLAIHGVVAKKDGTVVNLSIGEDPMDPVVGISDLLIHLASEQMQKKVTEAIKGEDLNICLGSMPLKGEEKDKVKANILHLLYEKYGIIEEDFVSAEIEIVPAGPARDYGLDRSMIIGYGQDDRVCAYASFEAQLEVENPERTTATILVDKEEIGSVGASGMHSRFFENMVAEVMELCGCYSSINLRRTMARSKMLSSDVTAGHDPNYASVLEKNNAAYFGKGVVFMKYTGARGKSGSNEANAEYVAQLRRIMEENNVTWQTAELGRIDLGGGGTIAYILAEYGMDVIDCGVPVHSMHAPWEVTSKADLYEMRKAYIAFLQNA